MYELSDMCFLCRVVVCVSEAKPSPLPHLRSIIIHRDRTPEPMARSPPESSPPEVSPPRPPHMQSIIPVHRQPFGGRPLGMESFDSTILDAPKQHHLHSLGSHSNSHPHHLHSLGGSHGSVHSSHSPGAIVPILAADYSHEQITVTVNGRQCLIRPDAPWADVVASIKARLHIPEVDKIRVYTLTDVEVHGTEELNNGDVLRVEDVKFSSERSLDAAFHLTITSPTSL